MSHDAVMEKLDAIEQCGSETREDVKSTRELAEEQRGRIDALEERYGEVTALKDAIEAIGRSTAEQGLTLPGAEDVAKDWSWTRVQRALVQEDPRVAPIEWEVAQQTAKYNEEKLIERGVIGEGQQSIQRTMTTLTGATGGFLVPEEIHATFYPEFYANLVMQAAGVTTISGLTGWPYRINKQTSGTTAYRHGEGAAPTASDIALGRVNLEPKKLSVYTVLTREDVQFTNPSIDGLVARDQMRRLALRAELDFFEGSGAANTPLGVLNTTGVTDVGLDTAAGDLEYEDLIDMELTIANANALQGNLAYITKPGVVAQYRKQRVDQGAGAGTGSYLTPPGGPLVSPHPVLATTALTQGNSGTPAAVDANSTFIYFGNWADAIHALWGGMIVRRSDQASDGTHNYFTEDKVGIITTMWDDVGVVRPASLCYDDSVAFA